MLIPAVKTLFKKVEIFITLNYSIFAMNLELLEFDLIVSLS